MSIVLGRRLGLMAVSSRHYGYDTDDNRTTYQNTNGTAESDVRDVPGPAPDLRRGDVRLHGEWRADDQERRLTGDESYTYDALGNLLHVGPPTGSAIDYVVDGQNRRVGKKVGGTLTQGLLYQDALNVVAQLNASGTVMGRFVFASKPNVPDYYTTSSGTFRILSDHLGSPRLAVNSANGGVVEQIDYDEFGNVTTDTSPGLTPFGFAGGSTTRIRGSWREVRGERLRCECGAVDK